MAFVRVCIPIYYGPDIIFNIVNEKAFVFYNISDLERDKVKFSMRLSRKPIVAQRNAFRLQMILAMDLSNVDCG